MSFACSLHLILRINIMAFFRMRESRFHAWFIRSYVEFVAVVDVLDRIAATISSTRLQCRHWQPGSQQKWEMKWRCLLHINNSSLYKRSFVAGVRAQPKTLCSLSHWRRCVRYQKVIFLFTNALCPLHHRTLIFFCFSDSDTHGFYIPLCCPKAHFQWRNFRRPALVRPTRAMQSCVSWLPVALRFLPNTYIVIFIVAQVEVILWFKNLLHEFLFACFGGHQFLGCRWHNWTLFSSIWVRV